MKQDDYDYLKDQYDWDNIKENKEVKVLDIQDDYRYTQPELIALLKEKCTKTK